MLVGGVDALHGGESTMILHIKHWPGYVICASFLALAALVGACQLRRILSAGRDEL
jgi:hypothetical protein